MSRRVAEAGRVQAWLCGSGLGTDERARDELRAVLGSSVPVVLDADALTMLSDGELATWLRQRDAPTVVTPHDREFARIAGDQVGPDRVDGGAAAGRRTWASWCCSRATARSWPPRTVPPGSTRPGHRRWPRAGTGDVLAGLLVSLLAAGLPADRAAIAAAFVHGLAGRRAHAESGGGHAPVTATDVAAALPATLGSLG